MSPGNAICTCNFQIFVIISLFIFYRMQNVSESGRSFAATQPMYHFWEKNQPKRVRIDENSNNFTQKLLVMSFFVPILSFVSPWMENSFARGPLLKRRELRLGATSGSSDHVCDDFHVLKHEIVSTFSKLQGRY